MSALIQQSDGSTVIASVENNAIHLIPVDTGVESDIEVEIIPKEEGTLTEGMQIVETPMGQVTEGMAVSAVPAA